MKKEEEAKRKLFINMEVTTNNFGERVTRRESTKHPTNPNFMQRVFWTV